VKFQFYLLFTALGLFHAEVLSWSSPTVLLNPLVFWYVAPVYAVHYIVFGDIILRRGRFDFWILYAFGCLTGLYEFVITKVYWFPPWNMGGQGPFGVAWFELFMIGFVWHAFMSFYFPFRLLQRYFFPGGPQGAQPRDLRILMLLAPINAGAFGLVNLGNGPLMIAIVLASLGMITLVAALFVRAARQANLTRIEDLVLSPRARKRAILWFALVYGFTGIFLRPEYWGTGMGLLVPVLFYWLFAGVLYAMYAMPSPAPPATAPAAATEAPAVPSLQGWLLFVRRYAIHFALAFGGLWVVWLVFAPLIGVMAILSLVVGFLLSVYFVPRLVYEAAKPWRRKRPSAEAPLAAPPPPV
jgi:hypothetical protein